MDTISKTMLETCAEDLTRRIDPVQEEKLLKTWMDFYEGNITEEIFTPPGRQPSPPEIKWPQIHINDAQDGPVAMALSELKNCSDILANGGNALLNVRCNYGTGILPSLFGCELFTMPRETHTLPTARPLTKSGAIAELVDAGLPDLETGLGANVFNTGNIFREILDKYDTLNRWVKLYHPDLQGPIDVAEVVWGSDIFIAFYDQPELIENFLSLATQSYAAFMRRWETIATPDQSGYSQHWGLLIKGRLMIRNDSLMNLSPEIYTDFIRDCDQQLFDEFGGGAIHYCGRGDHFIAAMSEMKGLTGINLSQPHLNDMETIYANTVDRGIRLIPLAKEEVTRARESKRPLRSMVCVTG